MTIEIIEGDCLDVLRTLPDATFDALVTDPPFGLGKIYNGEAEVASTPETYWEWLSPRYQESLRTVKPGGFIAVWQATPYLQHLWGWFGSGIRIFVAAKNFVQIRKIPINYSYDPVVVFYKGGAPPLCPPPPRISRDFFLSNTAKEILRTENIEADHPFPRPTDVTQYLVSNFTSLDANILDPFVGSGTTAVAAKQTRRSCTGIEIDSRWVELSRRRLALTASPPAISRLDGFEGAT